MSYEKQTWVNGEVITADKLNHMENGIGEGSGGTVTINARVTRDAQSGECTIEELDKTFEEVVSLFENGTDFRVAVELYESVGDMVVGRSSYCLTSTVAIRDTSTNAIREITVSEQILSSTGTTLACLSLHLETNSRGFYYSRIQING